jgi:hypothetical protein
MFNLDHNTLQIIIVIALIYIIYRVHSCNKEGFADDDINESKMPAKYITSSTRTSTYTNPSSNKTQAMATSGKHINDAVASMKKAAASHPITAHPDTITNPQNHIMEVTFGGITGHVNGHQVFTLPAGNIDLHINDKTKHTTANFNGEPKAHIKPDMIKQHLLIQSAGQ